MEPFLPLPVTYGGESSPEINAWSHELNLVLCRADIRGYNGGISGLISEFDRKVRKYQIVRMLAALPTSTRISQICTGHSDPPSPPLPISSV
jgi:hypothetical protein